MKTINKLLNNLKKMTTEQKNQEEKLSKAFLNKVNLEINESTCNLLDHLNKVAETVSKLSITLKELRDWGFNIKDKTNIDNLNNAFKNQEDRKVEETFKLDQDIFFKENLMIIPPNIITEEELINKLGNIFNDYVELSKDNHPDDNREFTDAIHQAQRILMSQIYRKSKQQ